MAENHDEVAWTEVTAVLPSGQRTAVRISIERPIRMEHGDWSCRVAGSPVIHCPSSGICGVDSLQALALATRLLRFEMKHFVAKGGRLLHPDATLEEDVDVDAIFGASRDLGEDLNG